ncbi:ABC transporter ATP-binding protein [Labrys okinawensis]|uniref:ABC transporter ATP-binding protein n=1 Tax=Labrys okinawensis TaxID=346911 RepID=UPI0039BCDDFD
MSENILEVSEATKVFGGLRAVNGVTFSVRRGEMLGIAGPNGSGKSTLFNLITSVPFGPTSGEIRFKGERVDRWPAHRIARAGLLRTFQKDAEFPDLSANETLAVCATYNAQLSRTAALEKAEAALATVKFGHGRSRLPSRYLSVYEKKQLMIASALVSDPALLMLDEPASGLTKPEIEQLDDLLVAINRSGVTVLLIEHVLSLLLSVSERLIVLNQGKVLAEGKPVDVVGNPEVITAYLGGRTS